MDFTEEWSPVDAPFSLKYEVSNKGRVRINKPRRLLKQTRSVMATGKPGYMKVWLSCNELKKLASVHRLVAKAFVPGDTALGVNHKDLDKCNNLFTNLEWMTQADNLKHARALSPMWSVRLKESSHKRAIIGVDSVTGVEVPYPSLNEAARQLTGSRKKAANICHSLKNGRVCYGKRWKYAA